MKQVSLLTLAMVFVSQSVFALEFNDIIVENVKAQNSLHSQIKATVSDSQIAAQKITSGDEKFIADTKGSEIINVKTKKSLLTFEKEKKHSKASASQNDKRLAQEFKDLE